MPASLQLIADNKGSAQCSFFGLVGDDEFGLALRRFCSFSFSAALSDDVWISALGSGPGSINALSISLSLSLPYLCLFICLSISLNLSLSIYLSPSLSLLCLSPWIHIDFLWMKCPTRARRRIEKASVADCMTSCRDHGCAS
jgi:hypothetical protein